MSPLLSLALNCPQLIFKPAGTPVVTWRLILKSFHVAIARTPDCNDNQHNIAYRLSPYTLCIDFADMLDGLQEQEYYDFLALEYVWVDWKGCSCTDNVSETVPVCKAVEPYSLNKN
jgi:hypothetical protein